MAWTSVYPDARFQDQSETKASLNALNQVDSVTMTVIQTWTCVWDDLATAQSVQTLDVEVATDGTRTIPVVGESYIIGTSEQTLICTRRLPKRSSNPAIWQVQVEFSMTWHVNPGDGSVWNIEADIDSVEVVENVQVDESGNPTINSAFQRYQPGFRRTFYDGTITISYQTTDDYSSTFDDTRGQVNSDTATFDLPGLSRSFDPRHLLFKKYAQKTSFTLSDGETVTYKVALSFLYRNDQTPPPSGNLQTLSDDGGGFVSLGDGDPTSGFVDIVLDEGWQNMAENPLSPGSYAWFDNMRQDVVDTPDGTLVPTGTWSRCTSPQPLNGSGGLLALSSDAPPSYWYNVIYIEVEADFTTIFDGIIA